MNRINHAVAIVLTGTGLLLLSGCGKRELTIKSYIDGSDVVKVSENKVWIEHEDFDLPGKNGNHNYPTYVNGVAWSPEWNEKVSAPYQYVKPAFRPKDAQKIKVEKRVGRGTVSITQSPASESGTLAIR